jgi:hypothetical protein
MDEVTVLLMLVGTINFRTAGALVALFDPIINYVKRIKCSKRNL